MSQTVPNNSIDDSKWVKSFAVFPEKNDFYSWDKILVICMHSHIVLSLSGVCTRTVDYHSCALQLFYV